MRNRVYGFAVRVSLVVLLSAGIAVGQQTTPSGTTDAAGASSTTTMTKGQLKAQKAQQKKEEKSADANAKASKADAKAKKQHDKAVQADESAKPNAPAASTPPSSTSAPQQ